MQEPHMDKISCVFGVACWVFSIVVTLMWEFVCCWRENSNSEMHPQVFEIIIIHICFCFFILNDWLDLYLINHSTQVCVLIRAAHAFSIPTAESSHKPPLLLSCNSNLSHSALPAGAATFLSMIHLLAVALENWTYICTRAMNRAPWCSHVNIWYSPIIVWPIWYS